MLAGHPACPHVRKAASPVLPRGRTTPVRDLSEGEMEELEDCLDAVQRPFPRLRRSTPLMQAVQCAEGLWDSDG
ncbi:unnamed protein product [Prorocentrum cordatum]|uniref:Uncharacterized protein n=1 Tax=Prorocentrum cordatum TaxID=2364126 RepID=A0ABN9WZL7_9DINO|nr:unnamed protein product [Polarella glacialis]